MMTLTDEHDIIKELQRHLLNNVDKNQNPNKASHQSMLSRRLTQDSRQVAEGDIFVALTGHDLNGADYIDKAIAQGASAVLVDSACQMPAKINELSSQALVITVPKLRQKLAVLCKSFYFGEQQPLPVIGITGTNGKTSISHLLAQLADLASGGDANPSLSKKSCAVIGTMGSGHINNLTPSANTTPGITDVYKLLAAFANDKAYEYRAVAMEVSSHALAQERVSGLEFETAVFTNLTHEHLDYHGSMEQYFDEKAKLFIDYRPNNAVINVDDSYGLRLSSMLHESTRVVAYGQSQHVLAFNEYVFIKQVDCHSYGLQLQIEWQLGGLKESTELNLPLYGEFNAENIAAVFATAMLCGWTLDAAAFSKLKPVPGRLELYVEPEQPIAIVDYAHTPDALEASLKAVIRHLSGQLYLVFGCGGDRDASKRPLMAEVAEKYSNEIIVTNDNPRTESQEHIVNDIMAGFKAPQNVTVEYDRKRAIELAVSRAGYGDAVLIAGKGHEDYQIIGTQKINYDERAFTAGLMASRSCASRVQG
ncbi:UDP-N-acetylmuramoyl-L-alanyl-D-glutamate--2,6-diaminopimelate ligase [Psychrosphaera aestuarii]|uniref:UDP-N-acetylmuramoyl-L-alanyl-D-glutamate--2, 6-diaminopimelate ligase n=1 Tax=Psychrosphaera aestuarii TaxID=1266052 RepID=UPI001B319324|nr:UDP-N-acetylmuramoyl-L-alanyl-D-glutamate--2,6-diaminopimelate ligase [Psychrosphaera aestuarii]